MGFREWVVLFVDGEVKRGIINGHTRYRPPWMGRGGKRTQIIRISQLSANQPDEFWKPNLPLDVRSNSLKLTYLLVKTVNMHGGGVNFCGLRRVLLTLTVSVQRLRYKRLHTRMADSLLASSTLLTREPTKIALLEVALSLPPTWTSFIVYKGRRAEHFHFFL